MLRAVLAMTVLLAASGLAVADYLLVKVDLNRVPFSGLSAAPAKGNDKGGNPMNPTGTKTPAPKEEGFWIYGSFECRGTKGRPKPRQLDKTFTIIELDHRWGKLGYFPMWPYVEFRYLKKDNAAEEFRVRRKKATDKVEDLLDLSRWALTHGAPKEFHATMAELKKASPKHPVVQSYERLQAEMKKPPAGDDPAHQPFLNELRNQGYRSSVSEDGHYVLYYKEGADFTEASLKRRKARLEETFGNFFYWFALQEKLQLPSMPQYRMPVLVELPNEFAKKQKEFGLGSLQSVGFTVRRENLVVLSAKPVDETYHFLEKSLAPVRQQLNLWPDQLVQGSVWSRADAQKNVRSVATIQMLTLLQKVMEDEAEQAAINREGVRQLLGATGILSRHVAAPEWLLAGVTSYFETPPGSLHPNFGLTSTSNLLAFKALRKTGKLGKSSDVLLNLATDFYYRQARNDLNKLRELDKRDPSKEERDGQVARCKEATDLAESTSWALVYYLSLQHKAPYLLRFTQQLNDMPRHMELSERTLQASFARAFELEDSREPMRMDPGKAQVFADAWFQSMEEATLENGEVEAFHSETKPQPPMPPKGK